MKNRLLLSLFLLPLAFAACSRETGQESPSATAEPAAATETLVIERTASPLGARVFFITPDNGSIVGNPVKVEFGIEGMSVAKAGQQEPDSGHHHLLIDTGLPDLDQPIPADAQHIHFGDGSTSTEITLPPGEHTLQMLLGDYRHVPHDPPVVSEVITIEVEN